VSNPELSENARALIDSQPANAVALLCEYEGQNKLMELAEYFSKQSGPMLYELAQVYLRGLGIEANPQTVLTCYKKAASRNRTKSQTTSAFSNAMEVANLPSEIFEE